MKAVHGVPFGKPKLGEVVGGKLVELGGKVLLTFSGLGDSPKEHYTETFRPCRFAWRIRRHPE